MRKWRSNFLRALAVASSVGCYRTELDGWAVPPAGGAGGEDARPDGLVEIRDAAKDRAVAPAPDTRDQAADLGNKGPEVTAPDATSCPDDGLSNTTQATAYVVSLPGSYWELNDLWICPGMERWFVLDLPAGHEMDFEACYDVGISDPITHVKVSYFREEFQDPSYYSVGGSAGSRTTCSGTGFWSAAGRYYFKVTSDRPQRYQVLLYGGTAAPLCLQDAYEPNDTVETATPLELGQAYTGYVCSTDVDWFALNVNQGQQLNLKLVGWFNGYELEMALLAPSDLAHPLATYRYLPGSDKPVSYLVQQSGVLLIRFRNVVGVSRTYTLTVTQ